MDEAQARTMLAEMQARLSRDPYEALGLPPGATPSDVRHAFLALTKRFHPARFGRMPPATQKLANEVFLALRAAHDTLARPTVKAPAQRPTGPLPVMARTSTRPQGSRTATPAAGVPAAPAPGARSATSAAGVQAAPAAGGDAVMRFGQRQTSPMPAVARPPTVTQPVPSAGPERRTSPPPIGASASRPTPGVPPGLARPSATGSQSMRPQATPAPATSAPLPGGASTPTFAAGTARPQPVAPAMPGRVVHPGPAASASGVGGDAALAPILMLLEQGQFEASRVALETLAARAPAVARYRALIAYARGREAQLARRFDEARVELQEALQLDPGLALAKTALGELFTRRK